MLPDLPLAGLLGGGLPALNQLTSYAYLTSHIPGLPDTATPLAALAPIGDLVPNPLAISNGLALPEGLVAIPSGLPFLGVGNLIGFPPPILDQLMSEGSPLQPLSTLLAPAQPTPALAVLEPISGFLLF